MQPLIWSNNSLNKAAVNLDQVIVTGTATSLKSTESMYSIVFHFRGKESTYWNYNNQSLRDQDYIKLLSTHCKDISQ